MNKSIQSIDSVTIYVHPRTVKAHCCSLFIYLFFILNVGGGKQVTYIGEKILCSQANAELWLYFIYKHRRAASQKEKDLLFVQIKKKAHVWNMCNKEIKKQKNCKSSVKQSFKYPQTSAGKLFTTVLATVA